MKFKTYSRQKKRKCATKKTETESKIIINYTPTYIVNFSPTFVEFNVYNTAKPDSSKSQSSDPFDNLMKGPTYNQIIPVRSNQPSHCLSESSLKFFSQRQNSRQLYKSDAELSVSTDISILLYKDSKNSSSYSPTWESPPQYRKIKNKLIKIPKPKSVSGKTTGRVKKKYPKDNKHPGPKKPILQATSVSCISSTPNTSKKDKSWLDIHVSPIISHPEHSYDASQDKKVANEKNIHGMTALIDDFENFGIETPHRENVEVANKEGELFDYLSPLTFPSNCQSKVVNKDCLPIFPSLNRSEIFNNTDSCEPGKGISGILVTSSPCQKGLEETGNPKISELKKEFYESSISNFININNQSASDCSSCIDTAEDQEHSLESNVGRSPPSESGFSNPEDLVNEKLKKEADSKMTSFDPFEDKTSDSSPNTDLKFGSVKRESPTRSSPEYKTSDSSTDKKLKFSHVKIENSKKFRDLSLSPEFESKENQYHSEEINGCDNLIRVKEERTKSQSIKEDHKDSNLITANCRASLPHVLKPCENRVDILKRSLSKVNKRTGQYSVVRDEVNLPPLASELNETLSKVNLEAGKKWRRSLLRQKQPEFKFDRRVSMSADTLVKLIKEASIFSALTNDTKGSSNNTSRNIDSMLDNQETRNNSLLVSRESSVFNFTMSKLTRRRHYIHDMNEIPEESSDHSVNKWNELEISKEQTLPEQYPGNNEGYENSVDKTVNDVYETPPLLKVNSEALSAITDRKRSRRHLTRSLGECSVLSGVSAEGNDESYEENNLFASCLSFCEIEDGLENLNDNIKEMGKIGFFIRCGQDQPTAFEEAFPERVLETGQKIGEGVFGEVFMFKHHNGISVVKIIPVEGSQMVNGAPQKRFDEVLSELIITEELSMLRQNSINCTTGFCELKNKFYLQGQYPSKLLKLWNDFDAKKGSENQSPDMFGEEQLYLGLELAHAGEPVETFRFQSPRQALAIFLQTTFSIAVAESAADFEHRDLHIGNILVQTTSEKYVTFILNGSKFETPTFGTMATIIDYTLSRISFKGDVLYFDLEKDPELFQAENDYQFDVYRDMRTDLNRNWRDHQPKTNVRWLHYLVDKLTSKIKYKQKKIAKIYKEYMEKLLRLKENIMDFYSATDLAQHLIDCYSDTESLIRR